MKPAGSETGCPRVFVGRRGRRARAPGSGPTPQPRANRCRRACRGVTYGDPARAGHPKALRRRTACSRKHGDAPASSATGLGGPDRPPDPGLRRARGRAVERPDQSGQLAVVQLPPRRPAGLRPLPRRLGAEMGLGRAGRPSEGRGRTALGPRPLRRQQGQGRGDRRPLRGLAAGRPAGGLPLQPGVGPGRAPHHADRRRPLRRPRTARGRSP